MRGAPEEAKVYMKRARIIPADAGSTCRKLTAEVPDEDHPRGCGEHHSRDPMSLYV